MDLTLFLRGVLLGLAVAAAVGPMAILTLRRTLVLGPGAGVSTGAGIAMADGVYAALAAAGLTFIADLLVDQRTILQVAGGVFLCLIGFRIARSAPVIEGGSTPESGSIAGWFLSAFGLTLTNPMTIASFGAMFAGLGLASAATYTAAVLLVSGVMLGSIGWWILVVAVVTSVGRLLTQRALTLINTTSGVVIFGFGIVAIATVVLPV